MWNTTVLNPRCRSICSCVSCEAYVHPRCPGRPCCARSHRASGCCRPRIQHAVAGCESLPGFPSYSQHLHRDCPPPARPAGPLPMCEFPPWASFYAPYKPCCCFRESEPNMIKVRQPAPRAWREGSAGEGRRVGRVQHPAAALVRQQLPRARRSDLPVRTPGRTDTTCGDAVNRRAEPGSRHTPFHRHPLQSGMTGPAHIASCCGIVELPTASTPRWTSRWWMRRSGHRGRWIRHGRKSMTRLSLRARRGLNLTARRGFARSGSLLGRLRRSAGSVAAGDGGFDGR
ncbi:hypothetical protein SAMN04487982_110242 [Streptomyces sp. ok210]|nr:hypothetical protein SAMN04487982_110242 [Streptomyces sp. ok210]